VTRVEGVALVVPGDDVDTDVMYPGAYLNVEDPAQMAQYLFEGFDPSLRERVVEGTILVVGSNFGIGSSREHVPQAMKAWGVRAVVGPSFARIFRRNCVNLGLLVLEAPEASAAARPGSRILIDTDAGEVEVDGERYAAAAVAPLVQELQSAGGLVEHAQTRVGT
jgi:3-isopropylmalate/(R)-2-methylmalate dehydratase small subunit